MGTLIRAALVLVVLAAPARAEDPPPPKHSLGWSLSCGDIPLGPGPEGERFLAGLGLQFGRLNLGPIRIGVEYDWLHESAAGDFEGHGYGQRLGVAAHLPVLDGTLRMRGSDRKILRGYLAAEAGAGGMWIHDSQLGTLMQGEAFAGIRAGYEMFGDEQSPARRLDDYVGFRWTRHPEGNSFQVVVGMEWGD